MTPKKCLFDFFLCLGLALIWSLPSLLNQFPMSYYDTAYYLYNTLNIFSPSELSWRPITYSLFLTLALTPVGFLGFIVLQNGIVAGALLMIWRSLAPNSSRLYFFTIGCLLLLTPLPHISNFLMPDIFTGLAILCLICSFGGTKKTRPYFLIASVLFSAFHYANFAFLLPIFFVYHPFFRRKKVIIATLGILSFLALRFFLVFPKNHFEQTAHMFLLSRFAHYKIVPYYLEDNCPMGGNTFCDSEKRVFNIWALDDQQTQQPNSATMNSIVLTNQGILKSHYFPYYLFLSIKQSFEQLITFARPMEYVNTDGTLTYHMLQAGQNFPFTHQRLFSPPGFNKKKYLDGLSILFFVISSLSIFLLTLAQIKKKLSPILYQALNLCTLCYGFHALAIGFLSVPLSRYSNRIIWIFTFLLFIHMTEEWKKRKRTHTND